MRSVVAGHPVDLVVEMEDGAGVLVEADTTGAVTAVGDAVCIRLTGEEPTVTFQLQAVVTPKL
jgi:hypothetical protein